MSKDREKQEKTTKKYSTNRSIFDDFNAVVLKASVEYYALQYDTEMTICNKARSIIFRSQVMISSSTARTCEKNIYDSLEPYSEKLVLKQLSAVYNKFESDMNELNNEQQLSVLLKNDLERTSK